MSAQQSTPRDETAAVTPQSAPSRGTDAVARTVYLQAPGRAPDPGSMMVRLVGVYVTTFSLTSVLVLGGWLWVRGQRVAPVPPAPEIRIVEVEKQVPVPVPVFLPAPVVEPPVDTRPPVRPNPRPAPKPIPAPAPVEPAPTVTVRPAPPAPAPAPVAPAPPAQAPEAVRALTGVYRGRGAGDDLLLELLFSADGKLSGRAARGGRTADATGTWEQVGDLVSFVLLERSGDQRMAYSGSVGGSSASGRMSAGGTNVGKFQVGR